MSGSSGTRQPVTARLRPGLRDRVWERATGEHRTLNEQINVLIERGLESQRPLADVFGSEAGFALAKVLLNAAEVSVTPQGAPQGRWVHDPETFERAADTIRLMLQILRPKLP